jgi:hypothetical protein
MARGRPFEAGNKAGTGRRVGSRNRKTVFQIALESDGEKIIEKIKARALKSDPTAMRLCIERLIPVLRPPLKRFVLPAVDTAEQLKEAIAAVTQAVADGVLSAQEGESVARIIETQRKNIEAGEFEARLKALEDSPQGKKRR